MNRTLAIPMLLLLAVLVVIAMELVVTAQEPATPQPTGNFPALMRMKLERSKAILEGLAMEDYDRIAQNSNSLKLLSLESGWNTIQTGKFKQQSNEFRRTCDSITEAAEARDIHRAALGYVALSIQCVDCHSYMRRHTRANPTQSK